MGGGYGVESSQYEDAPTRRIGPAIGGYLRRAMYAINAHTETVMHTAANASGHVMLPSVSSRGVSVPR